MTKDSAPNCQCYPWIGYLFFFVLLAGTFVLGMMIVSVSERRAEHAKRSMLIDIPAKEMDAAVWGRNFPRQYDSWKKTQDGTPLTKYGGSSTVHDYLRSTPEYVILFAGSMKAKEYNRGRGHWHAIDDVTNSKRITPDTSAACWQCKSPDAVRLIEEMGVEAFSAKKFSELKGQVTHAVSCYDCHDEKTLALRSLRPNVLKGFESMDKDMNKLTHQEKRSAICAQCHSTYHFEEQTGVVTSPWSKGLLAENIEEYYQETEFSDWTHSISGAKMIKIRHPDYELYTTSLHYARNVSCSDCHMPYKTEGAEKFTDHHIRSPSVDPKHPLSAIANTCSVCHRWSENDAKDKIVEIQDKVKEVQNRGMTMLVRAHFDIAACMEAGATDEELAAVREELRYAQMHWDFVASSNGMGFHAPQESQRILATALDRAAKVRIDCAIILAKKGYADEVVYPEYESKPKAQATVEKFVAGEKPSLLKKK
jgi:nitrite reductase (cytochrome c-552)